MTHLNIMGMDLTIVGVSGRTGPGRAFEPIGTIVLNEGGSMQATHASGRSVYIPGGWHFNPSTGRLGSSVFVGNEETPGLPRPVPRERAGAGGERERAAPRTALTDALDTSERLLRELNGLERGTPRYTETLRALGDSGRALADALSSPATTNAELEAFIRGGGIGRIMDVYFPAYRDHRSAAGGGLRPFADALEALVQRVPDAAAGPLAEGRFGERFREMIDGAMGQRGLFFHMARTGPPIEDGGVEHPYFHRTHHGMMGRDSNNPALFPELAGGRILADAPSPINGRMQMDLYQNGGFELSRIVAMMSARRGADAFQDNIRDSGVLESMFRFGTHPSPINAHVSLSAFMMRDLATVMEADPAIVNNFIDRRDGLLFQTPREFIRDNNFDTMPFMALTDPKQSGLYRDAFRGMAAALERVR